MPVFTAMEENGMASSDITDPDFLPKGNEKFGGNKKFIKIVFSQRICQERNNACKMKGKTFIRVERKLTFD